MTAFFQDRELAANVTEKLKIYAQPQRLMILSCLLNGERNVSEIGDATGITQPALSQQLAELRRADLVSTRKEAKQVWYMLANESVKICVQTMEAVFGNGSDVEITQVKEVAMTSPSSLLPAVQGAASFARIL
ncbi:ArsR Predicted transcriptional regulators [Caulobacteraceae bacterium]